MLKDMIRSNIVCALQRDSLYHLSKQLTSFWTKKYSKLVECFKLLSILFDRLVYPRHTKLKINLYPIIININAGS